MKKMILALTFLSVFGIVPSYATTATATINASSVKFPTPAENSYLNDQVIVTLLNHGTFYEEYRHGQKQMVISDNVIEAGHVNNQYLWAITANLNSQLNIEGTLRLNANALINKYVTYTPQWAWLGNLEYFPAVGYDFGEGHDHAWIATVNLGFGFGAGSGVLPVQ